MARTIRTILEAVTSQHDTAIKKSASVAEQYARASVQSGVRVDEALTSNAHTAAVGAGAMKEYGVAGEAALSKVEQASRRAVTAQKSVADAAGRVAAAEARLASVRKRSGASTATVVAAEESLARAQRSHSAALVTYENRVSDVAGAQRKAAKEATALAAAETAAAREARELAASQAIAERESRKFFNRVSQNSNNLNQASNALGLAGAAVGAGVLASVNAAAEFDQSISNVAATGDDAKRSLSELRQQALDLGAATKFSATEAADGQEALLKANVSVADVTSGALKGSLDLAAAGNLGVADSAEIAATAMTQFGKQGKDVPHIADLLAAAAGKAQGEVVDMANALKYVGPVAGQMNVSLEETAGTIALFAQNGQIGEQAGTGLRGVILSLTAPSEAASKAMAKYGIDVYDAQGKFIGFRGAAEQLQTKLGKLDNQTRDAAFGQIFGNAQVTAARILYAAGAKDVDKWTQAVDDNGFASEVAQTKMNNLRGDLEQLGGAFQTALIGGGEGGQSLIRDQVQAATGLLDVYNDLPGGAKTAVGAVGSVAGASALAGAGLIKIVQFGSQAKETLDGIGVSGRAAALGAGAIGIAVTVAGAALSAYAKSSAESRARVDELTEALKQSNGALDENVRKSIAKSLQDRGALEDARALGLSLATVTDSALGNAQAYDQVRSAINAARAAGENSSDVDILSNLDSANNLARIIRSTGNELDTSSQKAKDFSEAVGSTESAAGGAASAAGGLTSAQAGLQSQTDSTNDALQDQIDKFTILRDGALGQERANAAWQASLDDVSESVRDNRSALAEQVKQGKISSAEADRRSHSLDVNTAAGRKNRDSITGAISALNDKVTADFKANVETKGLAKATDIASAALKTGRARILDSATAADLNRNKVKGMQDRMLLTPKELRTKITTPGLDSARSGVQGLDSDINGVNGKSVDVKINWRTGVDGYKTSFVGEYFGKGHAKGGILPGHTPLSRGDDIMFPLATGGIQPLRGGEGITVTEAMDDPYERKRLHAVNAAALRGESLERFQQAGLARGGTVGRQLELGAVLGALPDVAAVTSAIEAYAGRQLTEYAGKRLQKNIDPTGGPVAGGGYAKALEYARANAGHPYIFGSLWDCSGFMSSLQSIILGEAPHRRYVTPNFVGPKAEGFTRGKKSPFMVGVNPSPGKFGHMAGTLNGVNVESAGGVGVRVGPSARGYNAGMFSWRGGLAEGGRVPTEVHGRRGDLPYDTLDPHGQQYLPELADLLKQARYGKYDQGGQLQPGLTLAYNATGKPEPVLNGTQWATLRGLATGGLVQQGAATGGYIGVGYKGPTPARAETDLIRRLIAAISTPLRDLAVAAQSVKAAQQGNTKAQAALRTPKASLVAATKAYTGARDDRDELRLKNAREIAKAREKTAQADARYRAAASKDKNKIGKAEDALDAARAAARGKKGRARELADDRIARARAALKGARSNNGSKDEKSALDKARAAQAKVSRDNTKELAEANAKVTSTSKAKTKAQDAYNKAVDRAKTAAEKLKDAQAKLRDVQQQIADQARQISDAFTGLYQSASSDAADWVASMKNGAAELAKFNDTVLKLRAKGLNEATIQQIVGVAQSQGAAAGQAIADSVLQGGSSQIGSLNSAASALQQAADALGYTSATGQGRTTGSGTTLLPAATTLTGAGNRAQAGLLGGVSKGIVPAGSTLAAVAPSQTIVVKAGDVKAYVTNPFTGKEIEAKVRVVAVDAVSRETGKVGTRY